MSTRTYRVGVIGFAHMHINSIIRDFDQMPNVQWVACADSTPVPEDAPDISGTRRANMNRALNDIGIPRGYDDYREMLAKEQLDIVLFCPENARSGEVAEAIAAHGAHMVTEKPMAASVNEALRMAQAAKNAGVALVTNWPTTWSPAMRQAKRLVDDGVIGDVWQVKWRNGASLGPLARGSIHPGDTVVDGALTDAQLSQEWWYRIEEGGGALLDYCCYGACIATWFLGHTAVSANGMAANLKSPFGNADDNAIITVRYPEAMAVLEASWTTYHTGLPTGTTLYGTKGTIVVAGREARLYTERGKDEPTAVYEGDPLPEGRATLAEEVIHHLETGDALHPTLDVPLNVYAMAILDAGIRSAKSGQQALINDRRWSLG